MHGNADPEPSGLAVEVPRRETLPVELDAVNSRFAAIPNPPINITLEGRANTCPKRRCMTRVPELLVAGVTVVFGWDCVMDDLYQNGSGAMLDVAHLGRHVAQMTAAERSNRPLLDGIAPQTCQRGQGGASAAGPSL